MPAFAIKEDDAAALAAAYRSAVSAATKAGIAADPEAQITTPLTNLIEQVAALAGIGELRLIRESQLDGSRPDFGVLVDKRFCGWIELKKPQTDISAPETWTGHDGKQWKKLSELDNVLLCNGREVRWFKNGDQAGHPVALPYDDGEWSASEFAARVELFAHEHVAPITAVSALAKRLAPLARNLRDALYAQRSNAGAPGHHAACKAHDAWKQMLKEDATEAEFADAVAQVITYSLVIAALEGGADSDGDGVLTLGEAKDALHEHHRLLSAALGPILGLEDFMTLIVLEVGAIERLVSGVDVEKIHKRKDPRGEPWLWFYEDFLAAYDPEARKQAGVYYTPVEVVGCIVRLVEDALVERFDRPLGFGDPGVTTLDPAAGTGTFPLAVVDSAIARAVEERGPAGGQMAALSLTANLFGFELLPGPYAVTHLRVGQRLASEGVSLPPGGVSVMLADTLASPNAKDEPQLVMWGDSKALAEERIRAQAVKQEQPVTVVLGNPPYDRVAKEDAGGWVLHGDPGEKKAPLFQDVIDATARHKVRFSYTASLYNLYTYFWRWAMWKAFEQRSGPAVVAFITGSTWLSGPAFVGLRELALRHADDVYIVDLGGDDRSAISDENVFAIQSPVAITVLVRDDRSDGRSKASVHYRRIEGSRAEKLAGLGEVTPQRAVPGEWQPVAADPVAGFVPGTGGSDWEAMPALKDLMPWAQPGCKWNRMWPVAPDPETLRARWDALVSESDPDRRAELFVTARTGRNLTTEVSGMARLGDLQVGAEPERLGRYGWRSFDRQWAFDDPRLAKTDSPALWQSVSLQQLFLVVPASEAPGPGPVATVSPAVPDKHYFMGRGGKDVIPLYRDAAATEPNVTDGLLGALTGRLGIAVEPADFAAYLYALLSTARFQERFAVALQTAGVRVPLTADPDLWQQAVALGRELLWLHTFAERFRDEASGRGTRVPKIDGLEWTQMVTAIPATIAEIEFRAAERELHVGDGVVSGVDPEVWSFEVSGLQVVRKWLGSRTAKGIGNAATKPKPLDLIRPQQWVDAWNDELLDLLRVLTITSRRAPEHAALLDAICDGELVGADDLPQPAPGQERVPATKPRGQSQGTLL